MEGRLDVDYRVSLNESKYPAYWNIKGDQGKITFYLPGHWDAARQHSDFFETDHPEEVLDNFIEELIYSEITERICIERAHEGIRMKGRTRCKPNCCVRRVADLMYYHDRPHLWPRIRLFNPLNAPPREAADVDRMQAEAATAVQDA
jgi:hypothetical protein